MKGQWRGKYAGSNAGIITVNVDEFTSYYGGVAYLTDDNPLLPGSAVAIKTTDKNKKINFETNQIFPIDPQSGLVSSWEKVKHLYRPDVRIPASAKVEGSWSDDFLNLSWKTDLGTSGGCVLPKSEAGQPSTLIADCKNWDEFKEHVATLEGRRFLFRGQNEPRRLRTSFHRADRADMHRFLTEDIQVLHKHLSARTKHFFNLQIPEENGAFLSLAQHHGYPTPLLDWSYSPFVAAFFAYRGISLAKASLCENEGKVRIIIFDQLQWKTDWIQLSMLVATNPHVSIIEFAAIENERLIPQQSVSTITNLDDMETYIQSKGGSDKKYLWAIDLPMNERKKVINELSYMGITAGSLFPGLDGACEELRHRNFGF